MRSMYIYDPFDIHVRNISPLNLFYYLLGVLNYKNLPLIPLVPNQPPDLRIPEIKNQWNIMIFLCCFTLEIIILRDMQTISLIHILDLPL